MISVENRGLMSKLDWYPEIGHQADCTSMGLGRTPGCRGLAQMLAF